MVSCTGIDYQITAVILFITNAILIVLGGILVSLWAYIRKLLAVYVKGMLLKRVNN